MRSRKIVFFFPAFSSSEATAPLGILALATPLLRAGFDVRIVDSTITPNFRSRVIEELKDALCLAVSLVTGPMIRETVQIARLAKSLYPDKPVILGGWHPSLLPDQTLAAEYVDVVVQGQGEETMLEVAERVEAGESFEGIPGVGYKEDGKLRFNTPRTLKPIRELPPKAYQLADFDVSGGGRRCHFGGVVRARPPLAAWRRVAQAGARGIAAARSFRYEFFKA